MSAKCQEQISYFLTGINKLKGIRILGMKNYATRCTCAPHAVNVYTQSVIVTTVSRELEYNPDNPSASTVYVDKWKFRK